MADPAYGAEHRRTRARLLARAYNTRCPVCGKPMIRGQELHLDHSMPKALYRGSKGDRIVHAWCNTSKGARLGNALRQMRPSRPW